MKNLVFLLLISWLCWRCQSAATNNNKTDNIEIDSIQEDISVIDKTPIIPFSPDYDTTQWTDLQLLDSSIIIDMRYATSNNFVNEKMYNCGRCFLRPVVAKAIVAAHQQLQKKGLGLKMFDCYRPRPIQQKLWDKVPNPSYVTPPKKGSMHNRGTAVDLTIVDQNGKELDMGTGFDFFGKEAHHTYQGHSKEILDNRKLLRQIMQDYKLDGIRTEWWHYYYAPGAPRRFKLSDMIWNCDDKLHH